MILSVITFFKAVASSATLLAAGALAAIVGRLLPPLVAMLVGAGIVGTVAFVAEQGTEKALRAQIKAAEAKRDELVLTTRELRKTLSEQLRASEANAKTMNDLRAKLRAFPDNPDCSISKDIVDELNRIR